MPAKLSKYSDTTAVLVRLPQSLLDTLDRRRGSQGRAAWIRDAINAHSISHTWPTAANGWNDAIDELHEVLAEAIESAANVDLHWLDHPEWSIDDDVDEEEMSHREEAPDFVSGSGGTTPIAHVWHDLQWLVTRPEDVAATLENALSDIGFDDEAVLERIRDICGA